MVGVHNSGTNCLTTSPHILVYTDGLRSDCNGLAYDFQKTADGGQCYIVISIYGDDHDIGQQSLDDAEVALSLASGGTMTMITVGSGTMSSGDIFDMKTELLSGRWVYGIIYNDYAQNDIVKIIDSTGTTVVEYIYDSWGKALSVTGSAASSLGLDQPFHYRGYVYDTETGWYYLQSRYYDPNTCRFISADVLLSTGQGVLGHNAYAYCLDNPINLVDSNGQYAMAGTLALGSSVMYALSSALSGLMAGISSSIASIASAIASCWFIPVCVAAVAIAIVGIVYLVKQVINLCNYATQVISKVKAQIAKGGVKDLNGYSVYVIINRKCGKVVYVGMTRNFNARKATHNRTRFPSDKYNMIPIETGLTRAAARVLEQTLITAYSLDSLVNMINSISPSRWGEFKDEFNRMLTLIESWADPE